MSSTTTDDGTGAAPRRRYDSPARRQQMERTRERILAAGAELGHESESWDWKELTFRAVAERAGVGERTVYRHFPTERDLRDAIMARLGEQAGVDYDELVLGNVAEVAGRVMRSLGSFAAPTPAFEEPDDPTFVAVDRQRRDALLRAVAEQTPGWPDERRRRVAAALDIVWFPPALERLMTGWGMDLDEAIDVVAFAVDAISATVEVPADRRSGRPRGRRRG